MSTIFYAWQSDSAAKLNRSFTEKAVEEALKRIAIDVTVEASPRLDQDTRDEAGMVGIAETVFRKIDACLGFLADLTLVGTADRPHGDKKRTPNPIVVLELGYAAKSRGWDRVIGVMNTAVGAPEELPFDLRHRRWPLRYELTEDTQDRSGVRVRLSQDIEREIRIILAKSTEEVGVGPADAEAIRSEFHQQIRENRFAEIDSSEGIQTVLVVPILSGGRQLSWGSVPNNLTGGLPPIGQGGWSSRPGGRFFRTYRTADGGQVMAATEIDQDRQIRNPQRDKYVRGDTAAGVARLPANSIEREPLEAIKAYLGTLTSLGFAGTWYLDVSILNLKKGVLALGAPKEVPPMLPGGHNIVPDIVCYGPDARGHLDFVGIARALRQAFDFLWREYGYPRSLGYHNSTDTSVGVR